MMNRRGFTLIEMLGCVALLGIVLLLGLQASKNTVSTSLTQFRAINDSEVFEAARAYALENGGDFNSEGISCVKVNTLVSMGYLANTNDTELLNKNVKLERNKNYTITKIEYVSSCE